ncbi:MAG: RagB/SusD family nutrient uptake outer membrane protein [Prevotella sp.]|nr:RagB/SusD family nutrient uptake outer membrane protein [Prevotella sp.]
MKYKILKNVCVVCVVCSLTTGCSDFLDTESPSQQTSQVIYENEGMARAAVMGVYSDLAGTYVYGQKMSVNWQGVSDIELASGYNSDPSKELTSDTGAANFYSDWYNHTIQWQYIFTMAERASTAVEGIRNSEAFKSGNKAMVRYLGEALTLRSLSYFELVRRWGDIPYKEGTSASDLSNVYAGKTSRDSIYAALIRDMQEAIGYLPWMNEVADYNCERITKGFAKGLLARIALFAGGWSVRDGNQFTDDSNVEHYPAAVSGMEELNGFFIGRPKNWQEYYAIAEQQCAEIIGDAQNPHKLDPDYGDIWKTVNHLDYNAYNENLFEVANGMGYSGDVGTLMGREMDGNLFGNTGWGSSYVATNGYYFYSFAPSDKRRDYACYFPKFTKENNKLTEVMRNDMMNVHLGKWSYFWTNDAYRALALTASGRPNTGINWILMRYPDILLMFAEARYQLGEGADSRSDVAGISAREALEMVRERAFGAGSAEIKNYDADFFNAIVNERAWEFGGEGVRKLDLVRWGLLDRKIEEMKEALVKMYDGQSEVRIFDKVFSPENFPEKIYYKMTEKGESGYPEVDLSSVNFYRTLNDNPDPEKYKEMTWMRKENNQDDVVTRSVRILLCATGLRARYDYTPLLGQLQYGTQIQEKLQTYTMGNGVCNYRHLYSIYYDDIYKSNGYLKNSYGYDHSMD